MNNHIDISKFKVCDDKHFKLENSDPASSGLYSNKENAREALKEGIKKLSELQERLYASNKFSVLLIFQAMDAAGKDGTIKHVMSGINPQGCQVYSFKQPSSEELEHDFMWRTYKCLPERGRIGIFNRSYYEEVIVTKVHPELILRQQLPKISKLNEITDEFWQNRYNRINAIEKHLSDSGTVILKFFLNVSKEEQKNRFLERIEKPEKNWKFTISDVEERRHWHKYMEAYQKAIENTATHHAPWYVIPANHKWVMRICVNKIITEKLESLDLHYPSINQEQREMLQKAKKELTNE